MPILQISSGRKYSYRWVVCCVLFARCLHAQIPSGSIGTIAGTGTPGYATGGGVASAAQIDIAYNVAVDTVGNVYVADSWNHRIRKVTPGGSIADFAGNGTQGYSGDNGPATSASLSFPRGLAADATGNVFVSDSGNNVIREIQTNGVIKTVAGNGQAGNQGDGGAALQASIRVPRGLAVDVHGNLYIADSFNARIRKVGTDGKISTFAGTGQFDKSGDGGPAANADIGFVQALAFDANGNLYFTDIYSNCIRRIGTDGIIETLAGTGQPGFSGDNGPASSAALNLPRGLALDQTGTIYVADSRNQRIRRITPDARITTVVGTGSAGFSGDTGPANLALVDYPYDVSSDPEGKIFIADLLNYRVREARLDTPGLTIAKAHVGNFTQGQQNATYQVTVSNVVDAIPTSGMVTVTETVPSGLTLVSMSGTGWTCLGAPANNCTRNDVLAAGQSYPAITVMVNVASNATSPQVNAVAVSGGGSPNMNTSDTTTILASTGCSLPPTLHLTTWSGLSAYQAQTSITADTSVVITGSASVTLQSGSTIILGPNFRATAPVGGTSTTFHASIVPALANCSQAASIKSSIDRSGSKVTLKHQ